MEIMKTLLGRLFDFQKYENNEKLRKMINEIEGRFDSMLSDDELEIVSAAGDSQVVASSHNLNIHEKIKG